MPEIQGRRQELYNQPAVWEGTPYENALHMRKLFSHDVVQTFFTEPATSMANEPGPVLPSCFMFRRCRARNWRQVGNKYEKMGRFFIPFPSPSLTHTRDALPVGEPNLFQLLCVSILLMSDVNALDE